MPHMFFNCPYNLKTTRKIQRVDSNSFDAIELLLHFLMSFHHPYEGVIGECFAFEAKGKVANAD